MVLKRKIASKLDRCRHNCEKYIDFWWHNCEKIVVINTRMVCKFFQFSPGKTRNIVENSLGKTLKETYGIE